jgi:tetratricopeptide (TPR) repeat protein
MKNTIKSVTAVTSLWLLCATAMANDVQYLQTAWAKANYQVPADQREDAMNALAEEARQIVEKNPNDANLLIWKGIIVSTLAGEKGGLGALGLAKEAKASLEAALKIDPNALDGSAYTSLGTLYHKVPGWPIGFGSDKKAKAHLQKALNINPNGIDSNYFMAEFLFDEGEYDHAKKYLMQAEQAQDRPNRPVADAGRRQEIAMMRSAVDAKLN